MSGWKLMDRQSALVALFWMRMIFAMAIYTSSFFPILSPLLLFHLPHLSFFSPSLPISHIQRFSEMLKLVASISAKNTRGLQTGSRGWIQDFTKYHEHILSTHIQTHTLPLLLFTNTLRHRPAHRSINGEIQRESRAFWSASVGVAPLAA